MRLAKVCLCVRHLFEGLLLTPVKVRRIAAAQMRSASGDGAEEKAAFLVLAGYLMRQLLIHHARPLSKRAEKAELPNLCGPHTDPQDSLVEIAHVSERLGPIKPDLRRAVELRTFEGFTREETAQEWGCGTATIVRHWNFARSWLEEALAGRPGL
jgi:DNA-directed RNA polymerase specialized sigma24 family protein